MRRPAAALAALLAPTLIGTLIGGAVSAGMASAAAAQSAPPPLTLENAKPLAIPPRPRLSAHAAPPPAPPPLAEPQLMAFPDAPGLAAPAPVPPPPGPAGAPPVSKAPTAKPAAPALTPAPPPPAPVQAPPSVEERVAAASQPVPVLVAPPTPPQPAPAALTPPPAYARAGMLSFPAGSALLPEDSEKLLAAVAEEMRAAPTRRLQLRAYASGEVDSDRQARQLSLTRALAVRERLTALGVRSTRIDVRPLGLAVPPTDAERRDRVDLEYTSE